MLDMGDLGCQAQRIISDAREQADRILRQANADASRLREEAKAAGHAQGFERGATEGREHGLREGREQAHQEWNEKLTQLSHQWSDALVGWEAQRTAMLHEAREDLIHCVLSLTKKVILRTIAMDPTVVRDQLTETLSLLGKATAVEIVINPHDRSVIEEHLSSVMQQVKSCTHASIREDADMMRGGCVVNMIGSRDGQDGMSGPGGRIDASIETQLERIAEVLVPVISGA